jgi:hypothetical protein
MQKTKLLITKKAIEKIKEDLKNGDDSVLYNLLDYVPAWDIMYQTFREIDYQKFIEQFKE